jgi:MoaA/NifB/PqqE/SkfB family radical SAM enzyme
MNKEGDQLLKYNENRVPEARSMGCWAPIKSLYFGFRGNTSVCCFNKIHVVGKYPELTIREIWDSAKRKEIAQRLVQNDFSLGCKGCEELILAENYKALPAKNFDTLPILRTDYPSKMDFELSNECNLECLMCRGEFSSAIRKNREKLPPIKSAYDTNFVNQLEEFIPYLENSHFLGGEPFLIPIYLDIWERMVAINPNIRISIQTNGTILTERIKRIIHSMNFDIAVSIDSIEEDTYRVIRKNGEWKKVLPNVHYFREYCRENNTHFHISFCPMIQNWEELPKVVAFANELDCNIFFNTVFHPKSCSIGSLSSTEISGIIDTLSNAELSSNTQIEEENKRSYLQVISHFGLWKKEALEREELESKTGPAADLTTYLEGLKHYLQENSDSTLEEQAAIHADIEAKLNYIIDVAAENNLQETATGHIIEMNYKTVVESLPQMDREHALYLFKSFVTPLPD